MAQEIPIEELQKGVQGITWRHALLSAAVLLGSILLAKLAGKFIRWVFSRRVRGAAFAFSKLLTYGLVFAGAAAALGVLGMPLSSLVLTSSALLVGIGFSLQPVARDVVSGVVILVEQSIRKNDFVSFADTTGTVKEIGLRATQILTRDGTVLVVPNHRLVANEVTNHTHPFQPSRLMVELPTDSFESADDARDAIASVAERHPHVLPEPPPMVCLDAIEPGTFRFVLIAWVADPVAARRVASELRFTAARVFEERGIRFATPSFAILPPDGRARAAPEPEQPGAT